jgi:hypothetical protein
MSIVWGKMIKAEKESITERAHRPRHAKIVLKQEDDCCRFFPPLPPASGMSEPAEVTLDLKASTQPRLDGDYAL